MPRPNEAATALVWALVFVLAGFGQSPRDGRKSKVDGREASCIFDFERGEVPGCLRRTRGGELFVTPRVLKDLEFGSEGLAWAFSSTEGWMYVDRGGKVVVRGVAAVDNGPDAFHDGLVRIVRNQKYGFANRKGRVVIEPTYDGALSFENGRAKVCRGCESRCQDGGCEHRFLLGGQWYEIDVRGTVVSRLGAGP